MNFARSYEVFLAGGLVMWPLLFCSLLSVALLYATTQGMAVQIAGLRQQVDPHWRRGISYLKIGLRWLNGVLHKGRTLLNPSPLLAKDPQP